MTDGFEFVAPAYYDFQNRYDNNVMGDEFFDFYNEDGNVSDGNEISDESSEEATSDSETSHRIPLRRSMSVDNFHTNNKRNINETINSLNDLNLNGNCPPNNQFKRPISIENIQQSNYITLAEQTRLFHTKTPDRFKTKPQPVCFSKHQQQHTTIPQSPHLTTKMRSRPVQILTTEEREIIEMENLKKNRFKAQEVNKKVLEGTNVGLKVEKKPNTRFEPFNLTEIKKKVTNQVGPSIEDFHFHANPVQKKMFETVIGVPEKQVIYATIPKTPSFMKESRLRGKHLTINDINGQLEYQQDAHHGMIMRKSPVPTKVKPFNVIKRSEETQRRKEERIKRILEEEKKMREFHAKPAPKFIRKKTVNTTTISTTSSTCSTSSNEENQTVTTTMFKARPATVLHKKPFVPLKGSHPLTEIQEFQLSSNQRAKEREAFDRKIREMEETKKLTIEKQEEEKRRKEEEELNFIRQQAMIKAQPIKRFKEFILRASSKDLTSPHTPKFSARTKK